MALAPGPDGLLAQVLDLAGGDLDVPQKLAGEDYRRLEVVLVLDCLVERRLGLGRGLLRPRREAEHGVDCLDSGGDLHPLGVRAQGHGDAVEEVIAQLSLVGVECGDEQRHAGVGQRDPLTLDDDLALGHDAEEDVGGLLVEEVDVVDVQYAPVCLGE